MNGYSKIRLVGSTTKSKSIDFSDLFSSPPTHQTQKKPITNPPPYYQEHPAKQANHKDSSISSTAHDIFSGQGHHREEQEEVEEEEEGGGGGERFGAILSRSCSTKSSCSISSKRFMKIEKQNSVALQSAVKRAFSMRRSASVSEGYCRIHDQCDPPIFSPTHEDLNMQTRRSNNKTKKGKFLKACKRFFGLH